ncbi:MAG TPA: di-heme-cytochrome C peroxidase [Candidatus Binatia bacterium]|jgi:cytochrome c peroxidase|nr:di-heme-cytochrome C peroxidase [Candidatus Binatia bacterium]
MRKVMITLSAILVGACATLMIAKAHAGLPCSNEGQHSQGWSKECRQWFYHVNQGSQLIPHKWFSALEQPDNTKPFSANEVFERFHYIPDAVNPDNPHGLPVGFSTDQDPQDGEWLGMTCAACHTGEIEFESQGSKHKIRIDGGPALANLMGFLQFLYQSLDATRKDNAKFARFATKVLGAQHSAEHQTSLHDEVDKRTDVLKEQAGLEVGKGNFTDPNPAVLYGFGRVDALGLLTNQVIGVKMGLHKNDHPPDAPVSYPSLWYVPKFDKLQWNGSATKSVGRNIAEALGVFAHFIPPTGYEGDRSKAGKSFSSTVNVENLQKMWSLIDELRPPPWPGDIFGKPDLERVRQGREIYDTNEKVKCKNCHSLVPDDAKLPQGELVRVMSVGTDEKMATNFECRTTTTSAEEMGGKLEEFSKEDGRFKKIYELLSDLTTNNPLAPECTGKTGGEGTTPARYLVIAVGTGVTLRKVKEHPFFSFTLLSELTGDLLKFGTPRETSPKLSAYKAGPLNGIWATAPFLHNGSVPNLDQLLRPQGDRVKKFCVGSRKFDPQNVGFDPGDGQNCPDASVFDTSLPGNSNHGHSGPAYGTGLNDEERKNLIEYLKTL